MSSPAAEPARMAILRLQEKHVTEFLQRPDILKRLKELEFPYVVCQKRPSPSFVAVTVQESSLWPGLLGCIVTLKPDNEVSVLRPSFEHC
ncbi:MAG: hypothetical protein P4L67_02530 [Candidatus Pacebacteria bacterium]|nr:hypothetical protein [Candidatus Paceibacterota bacterium]